MQAVILAAGRGVRMQPLTYDIPKPMIKISGKNLLEHKLEQLPEDITEVIIVVGYLGDQIISFFGDSFQDKKITYVKQNKLLGTGKALWATKDLITGPFISMMGDDLYAKEDIVKCIAEPWAILSKHIKGKARGGRIELNSAGHVDNIIEGTHDNEDNFMNLGLFKMQLDIFNYELVKLAGKEEWGLPQTLVKAAQDFDIKIISASFWEQLTDVSDVARVEKKLVARNV